MKKIGITVFLILLSIVFIEPFGDSIFMNSFGSIFQQNIEKYDIIIKQIIILLFLIFVSISINKVKLYKNIHIPIYLILIIYLYALLWGIFSNNAINALNECSSIFPLFLVFILPQFPEIVNIQSLNKYIKLLVFIVFIKFLIYQLFFITQFGFFSWKVLMKQSVILLLPFSLYLNKWNNRFTNTSAVMIFLTLFLIVIAQARTLLIASLFIYFIVFFQNINKNFVKLVLINSSIFVFISFSYFAYLYSQNVNFIDSIEYLFSGNDASESVNFRMDQFNEIKSRILNNPILGKGFGYFNPNYSSYSELSKPYLLEMDMLNFISKIGIPFTILYIFSYIFFFLYVKKIQNLKHQKLYQLYFWCLVSFILYSFGQTMHQSYIYWFAYALIFSSLIQTVKNQNKIAIYV
jgi:hypothetical protein